MQNNTLKALSILLTLLISSACSHKSQYQPPEGRLEQLKPRITPSKSPDIEEQFRNIEGESVVDIERQRAIDTYYQMRLEERENPQIIQERRQQMIREENLKATSRQRPVQKQRTDQAVQVEGPPTTQRVSREVEEITLIEAQQNIDYFCIKHEDRKDWNNYQNCQDFAEQALTECRQRFEQGEISNLVSCIKRSLNS